MSYNDTYTDCGGTHVITNLIFTNSNSLMQIVLHVKPHMINWVLILHTVIKSSYLQKGIIFYSHSVRVKVSALPLQVCLPPIVQEDHLIHQQ